VRIFCRVFSVGHSAKQPLTVISPASTFILPSAFFALCKNFAECSINGTRQKYFCHQFSIVFGKIFAGCNMNFAEFFGHLAKRRNSIVDDQPHLLPLLSPYSRTQCARIVTTPVEYAFPLDIPLWLTGRDRGTRGSQDLVYPYLVSHCIILSNDTKSASL